MAGGVDPSCRAEEPPVLRRLLSAACFLFIARLALRLAA